MTRYMVALQPPADLMTEIKEIQMLFAKRFGSEKALRTPPHVTVVPPFDWKSDEKQLIELVSSLLYYQQPFTVQIENFNFFKEARVIYLQVKSTGLLSELHRNLVSRVKKGENIKLKVHPQFSPHITIGYRDLSPEVFAEAMEFYDDQHFRSTFKATGLHIWKHDGQAWNSIHFAEFALKEKPIDFVEFYESPIGTLKITADKSAIKEVLFDTEKSPEKRSELTRTCCAQLHDYFSGTLQQFTLPLMPAGTEFQKRVWSQLQLIPYGDTINYLSLSQKLGDPKAIRAVASANGKNPIPIIIPCHRVIGKNGSLTGFSGGLHRKQFLLELESRISGRGQASLF